MNTKAFHRWMAVALLSALLLAACTSPAGTDVPADTATAPTGGSDMTVDTERVRAWVLMTARDPSAAAAAISAHFAEGENHWVIVRADVIEGDENLMIAVDAENEDYLQEVLGLLTQAVGSEPQDVRRVIEHHPSVPHAAHSFITPSELDGLYAPEFDPPGRHMPKSPGANPWG
jgi:hypothetical protein